MLKMTTALVAMAALGVPAAAQEPKPKDEKMVCKWIKDTRWRTGGERVCKKRAEWDQITRETQKQYRDYGRTGSQGDLNGN